MVGEYSPPPEIIYSRRWEIVYSPTEIILPLKQNFTVRKIIMLVVLNYEKKLASLPLGHHFN